MGLDTVEFVVWAEKKFAIDIPDEDVTNLYTVGEFCRYLTMAFGDRTEPRAARQGGRGSGLAARDGLKAPGHDAIYAAVVESLVGEFRIPRDRISPDSRFVKDLGME